MGRESSGEERDLNPGFWRTLVDELRKPLSESELRQRAVEWREELTAQTPRILRAAADGDTAAVLALLEAEPHLVNTKYDQNGWSLLQIAARTNNLALCRALIEGFRDIVYAADASGCSALRHAVEFGDERLVAMILAADESAIDRQDLVGRTVLSYAIQAGRPRIVAVLLAKDFRIAQRRDGGGFSPEFYASNLNNDVKDEIVAILQRAQCAVIGLTENRKRTVNPIL